MRATRSVTKAYAAISVDEPGKLKAGDVIALRRLDERGNLLVEKMRVVRKHGHEIVVVRGADGTEVRDWPANTGIVRVVEGS